MPVGSPHLSPAVRSAIAQGPLGTFSPALLEHLLQDALPAQIPAGGTLYQEEDEPRCGLVVSGLIRVYLSASDGRQVTVRYARRGELLGLATLIGGPAPVSVQILTPSELLILNARTLQHRAQAEPETAWLMAREVTQRLYDTLEALAGHAFGSLRQRIARHLLDLAADRRLIEPPLPSELVAMVTQQALADAVGSVRSATARILSDLRAEGLISTSSDGIILLNPHALLAETWPHDGGT